MLFGYSDSFTVKIMSLSVGNFWIGKYSDYQKKKKQKLTCCRTSRVANLFVLARICDFAHRFSRESAHIQTHRQTALFL